MSRMFVLYLGSLMLRSIGIGLLAGMACVFVRRVALRHAIWFAVLGTTLLMPAVDRLLPAGWVPVLEQHVVFEPLPSGSAATVPLIQDPVTTLAIDVQPREKGVDIWQIASVLYIGVAVALLFRLAVAYAKVWKIVRRSRPIAVPLLTEFASAHQLRRHLSIRETSDVHVPLTVGSFRPFVLLPIDWRTWDEWKLGAVLSHELAHIRRADWAIGLLASFATCVFWFNPLTWWIQRSLSNLAEKASDEASLALIGDPARYAEILLQFTLAVSDGARVQIGGVAMARKNIRSRIDRILTIQRPGTGLLGKLGWVMVLAVAVPAVYVASAVHVEPAVVELPVISAPPLLPTPEKPVSEEQPQTIAVLTEPPRMQTETLEAVVTVKVDTPLPAGMTLVRHVDPRFPPLARQARIQGVVFATVTVVGGRPEPKIISGHPLLQGVVVDALKEWVFQGDGTVNMKIDFRLGSNAVRIDGAPLNSFSAEALARRPGSPELIQKLKERQLDLQRILQLAQQSPSVDPGVLRLRGELASINDALAREQERLVRPLVDSSYTFSLVGLQDRTLYFKSDGGRQSFSYGCENCTFLVQENAVGAVTGARGVLVRLSEDAKEIDLTCQARECTVTSTLPTSSNFVQTLRTGGSTKVSSSAQVTISFTR